VDKSVASSGTDYNAAIHLMFLRMRFIPSATSVRSKQQGSVVGTFVEHVLEEELSPGHGNAKKDRSRQSPNRFSS